jgi:hypothetical protein
MANKIIEAGVTAAKWVGAGLATIAISEGGFACGSILANDVELTVKSINKKLNPTIMKRKHWYTKPEEFNTRKGKFVSDMKKEKSK